MIGFWGKSWDIAEDTRENTICDRNGDSLDFGELAILNWRIDAQT